MKTHISILRGINVGGQHTIKMDSLKAIYEDLGYINVRTYIQSGNVVFQNKESPSDELEIKITSKIASKFGFDVPVIVLSHAELQKIVNGNPFLNEPTIELPPHHITFLSKAPDPEKWHTLLNLNIQTEDKFKLIHKSIYLYCPNGYGKTKLTNGFFEQKLGITATTRNWRTTLELHRMAEESKSL